MKKIILLVLVMVVCSASFAQSPLSEGNWLIETGLSPVLGDSYTKGATTGFILSSSDGSTIWSAGAEAGYFISDNTAVKFGAGFTDFDGTNFFSYKLGLKNYINGKIPIQIDITGATNPDVSSFIGTIETPDPLWLGLQFGYAAFINDNVAFEPALRYNISLNSDFTDKGLLELRFGFVIFLN